MQALAQEVAHYLGMDLGGIKIKRFADGEIYVQIQVALTGAYVKTMSSICCIFILRLKDSDLMSSVTAAAGVYPRMRCISDSAHLSACQ